MYPFFSIIIPVYNVAPYLRECLDSVSAQTFDNWEAICVDDGATDGSGAILDEYAAKDNRFKVIHQKNAGVSAARNAGLGNAKGEWFMFLDGDDALRVDSRMAFVPYLKQEGCPDGILVHPYVSCWNGYNVPARKVNTRTLIEDASKEDLFLGPYAANGYPFSRVYRRCRFGHLRFRRDIAMAEDVCFWFDALCVDARWVILNVDYYLYRQRQDSACGVKNPHVCIQALESVLHALHDIDRIIDSPREAKLKYLKRFPYTVSYNLNLAIAHIDELSDEERLAIRCNVGEIVNDVKCWPFGFWLKIKMYIVIVHKWSWLLPLETACEQVCSHTRRIAAVACRKMGLKRTRKHA